MDVKAYSPVGVDYRVFCVWSFYAGLLGKGRVRVLILGELLSGLLSGLLSEILSEILSEFITKRITERVT